MTSITVSPVAADYEAIARELRRYEGRPATLSALMAGLRPDSPERHLALAAALLLMARQGRVIESFMTAVPGKKLPAYALAPVPVVVAGGPEVFDPNV